MAPLEDSGTFLSDLRFLLSSMESPSYVPNSGDYSKSFEIHDEVDLWCDRTITSPENLRESLIILENTLDEFYNKRLEIEEYHVPRINDQFEFFTSISSNQGLTKKQYEELEFLEDKRYWFFNTLNILESIEDKIYYTLEQAGVFKDRAKSSKRKKSKMFSYKFLEESKDLVDLWKAFKDYFTNEMTYEQFKEVFSEKDCNNITPLIWKETISALIFWIDRLQEAHKVQANVDKNGKRRTSWQRMRACFRTADGSELPNTETLKSMKYKLDGELPIRIEKSIEKALKDLL